MKKINVIIPNYNYGEYLETCLLSIFAQRVDCEIEILVSDDCSSDQSLGILKRMLKNYSCEKIKLNFFENTINRGEVCNTKFLLNKCDGDYIAYMDADDYWINPLKLERQFNLMEEKIDYSMTYTGYLALENGNFAPHGEGDYFIGPPQHLDIKKMVSPEFIANVANCIFSSSRFFRNYGDLALNYFDNFSYSDWPLNFELSLRGKINYESYASYVYRIHQDSLSRKDHINKTEFDLVAWKLEKKQIFETRQNEYNLLNNI